jgi:DNA polymerase-3 subunit delta
MPAYKINPVIALIDLNDALLEGNLAQAMKIFQYLMASGEAMSLILWSISKEMRLLMQLFEQPQNALATGYLEKQSQCVSASFATFKSKQFLAMACPIIAY